MATALYRRYRPETFTEVIGQEHVTDPLQQALRNDRVHHAYLFSGPRGCGKTTSARILARCLNCEKGPTPDPCGVCDSCVALTRGGPGSMDVIEIDAASHGGVDDARDLREKAFFAPAASRFKIYIIDEAHMVSPAGFNALLKVVEEPPEHVKFIFATTEPEKVIGTIRSRTHHYPFRLVPPGCLQEYLGGVCAKEGVTVEEGVLPLVVRAGRGSVRDSLSVLDQLLAGAGESGVTYALAASLLGYIDATLLDDALEALAAGDGAAVFSVIDRAIEGGSDPRRFAEDLLERLRDLLILDAVPDAQPSMFGDLPADQMERMRQQAGRFGAASLSRAADIVNAGLTEMRGATSPRLHLELMCARVLLPAADLDERALFTRLERLERRLALGALVPAPSSSTASTESQPLAPAQAITSSQTHEPSAVAPMSRTDEVDEAAGDRAAEDRSAEGRAQVAETVATRVHDAAAQQAAGVAAGTQVDAAPAGGLDLTAVRRSWPDVLEAVKRLRRFTWTLLSHNASIAALDGRRLTLAMVSAGARDSFTSSGSDEILRQALIDVLGVDWRVEAILDPSRKDPPGPVREATGATAMRPVEPVAGATDASPPTAPSNPDPATSSGVTPPTNTDEATPTESPRRRAEAAAAATSEQKAEDVPSLDDPDAPDGSGLAGLQLLQRDLGARVIGEYDDK